MSELKDLLEKRDKFLQENPHLVEYQKSIDDILDKCKTEDRLQVITILLSTKLVELNGKLSELKNMLENYEK